VHHEYLHLNLHSKKRDVPKVILIKGSTCIAKAYSLIGQCDKCKTIYTADHESYSDPMNKEIQKTLFINSAKYLKVGSITGWTVCSPMPY